MSKYSPGVLPTAANPFASLLDQGFESLQATRAAKRAQQATETQRKLTAAQLYNLGVRDGPGESSDIGVSTPEAAPTTAPDFTPPSSAMLARGLRAGPSAPTAAPEPVPTGDDLAAALRGNLPSTTADPVELAQRTGATPAPQVPQATQQAVPKPGVWAGAFDSTTGTFGGRPPAPAAQMIGQAVARSLQNGPLSGKRVEIAPGVFLDPNATPEARQAVLAEKQRKEQQDFQTSSAVEQETRRASAQHATEINQQARDARTLAAIEPDHPAVKDRPFDPTGHLNYSVLLADALKRREAADAARATAGAKGVTLHATTVNVADKTIEDVFSDGSRKVVRKATPDEVRKAIHIAEPGEQYVWAIGADGKTQYVPKQVAASEHMVKPMAIDMLSTMAIPQLTRVNSAIQGLGVADRQMREYEDSILAGKQNLTGWDQFVRSYADAGMNTHGDPHLIDMAAITAASERLNRTNPALAKYVRALQTWALEDSNISGKPSDFRTRLDEVVSGIGPSPSADLIHNIQEVRGVRLKGYNDALPTIQQRLQRATGGRPGATSGSTPNDTPGNIDLRAPQDAAAAWKTANPQRPGESAEAWFKRFQQATKGAP